jgi:hypothetical protein
MLRSIARLVLRREAGGGREGQRVKTPSFSVNGTS